MSAYSTIEYVVRGEVYGRIMMRGGQMLCVSKVLTCSCIRADENIISVLSKDIQVHMGWTHLKVYKSLYKKPNKYESVQ